MEAVLELRKKNGPLEVAGGKGRKHGHVWVWRCRGLGRAVRRHLGIQRWQCRCIFEMEREPVGFTT